MFEKVPLIAALFLPCEISREPYPLCLCTGNKLIKRGLYEQKLPVKGVEICR